MGTSVNNKMIVLAREARGLNQHELADKIKMSPTNLSKIERGDVGISQELVNMIAEITSFPPHFFIQKGSIVPGNLAYRKRQKVAQRLLTPIHAQMNIIRQHVEYLTSALGFEPSGLAVTGVSKEDTPEMIARKLRKLWKIPPGPVQNLTQILEKREIAIVHLDFGTTRVDSKSILTKEKFPIICLNKEHTCDRMRFSMAYELAHLVMHTFLSVPIERNIEHEANQFAAEFLMPAKEITADFRKGISIPMLAELKQKWKVSMIALLYRADDLGLITPNQKRYLLQQFNQLQIRRREPVELDIPLEPPKLIKEWIAAYRRITGLGLAKVSALLCLNIDEFIELYC